MRVFTAFFGVTLTALASGDVPRSFLENPRVRDEKFVLWHDPGVVGNLDLRYGIGGPDLAPQSPFTFIDEDISGSTPKIRARDAASREWVIKFGPEASADTFCTRLAWAAGYYVEPTYFVAEGQINGVNDLRRANGEVDASGHFHGGRFQLRSREPKFLQWVNWAWDDNPFLGTPELNGLRTLMMLVSNWDDKDSRDADSRGTNTAIYRAGDLNFYFIDDWGGAMGHWGKFFTRSKWSAKNFYDQSTRFVHFDRTGVHWGYKGQHTTLMTRSLGRGDIEWILQYLGHITDEQLRTGLISSGATDEEALLYAAGLRLRIAQLQNTSAREH